LASWREEAFYLIFLATVIFGVFPLVSSVVFALQTRYWAHAAVYILFYGWTVLITFFRRLPDLFRIVSGVSVFFLLGLVALFTLGPVGGGRPMLFAATTLACLLMGLRVGLFVWFLSCLANLLIAWQLTQGKNLWPLLQTAHSQQIWSTTSITFLFTSGLVIGALAFLVRGLGESLGQEKNGVARLTEAMARLEAEVVQRKQTEAQMLTYQEEIRRMGAQVAQAEERERRRIANHLHDHIGQCLALSRIRLRQLERDLLSPPQQSTVAEVLGLVDRMSQDVRNLTVELSPPILHELGLASALEWLAEEIERDHQLTVDFEADDLEELKDPDVRILLFRAARELLLNVVKHARATIIRMVYRTEDHRITLEVEDDGVGWNPKAKPSTGMRTGGFGLLSLRERLSALGGTLEIESEPGKGARVRINVFR
jgi:signal transduction histidine kinase